MARAKHTARAEARRRYRATLSDETIDEAEDVAEEEPPTSARPTPRRTATQPERPSVVAAFRTSFRPLDIRGDLRALPGLLLTKAFLVPLDVSGLAFILALLVPNPITLYFYNFFSYQFPVAAVFVAGFFAKRASWLLGALIAILSTVLQFPLILGQQPELIAAVLVQGAVYGALFGGAAAWYRRFLQRANPNMAARQGQRATSRRPDGKIPRKPEQRPMLARRR